MFINKKELLKNKREIKQFFNLPIMRGFIIVYFMLLFCYFFMFINKYIISIIK